MSNCGFCGGARKALKEGVTSGDAKKVYVTVVSVLKYAAGDKTVAEKWAKEQENGNTT